MLYGETARITSFIPQFFLIYLLIFFRQVIFPVCDLRTRMITDQLIDVKNVTKIYAGRDNKPALNDVSLSLRKGEIISLLGANGAGKTTLSSIIATLHPPTHGTLYAQGRSIYDDLYTYRRTVGYCPQKPNFCSSLTVREHLLFAGRYFSMSEDDLKKRCEKLLDKFGLKEYAGSSPDVLSGGYKQRLLIARALIHNPSLVILDEPTVGLDVQIRRQLWDIIKELKNDGVTVLLTTHYLEEAEYLSDCICILNKGQIQLIDTTANLKAAYKKGKLEDVFLELMKEDEHNGEK